MLSVKRSSLSKCLVSRTVVIRYQSSCSGGNKGQAGRMGQAGQAAASAAAAGSASSGGHSSGAFLARRSPPLDELDPIILDRIFHKNKAQSGYTRPLQNGGNGDGNNNSNNSNNSSNNKNNDLSVIDENLKHFKSNIPVNFHYYLRNLNNLNTFKQLPYKFGENQIIENGKQDYLKSILWEFDAPIRYSFGYGSGVFDQGIKSDKKPQIDLIFAVTFPDHWHSLNLHQFPNHYSGLRWLGYSAIAKVQKYGAGVYFNPYVKMGPDNTQLVKYGVSSVDNLMSDLINWDTFYLSGRLHKPVAIIRNSPNIALLNQFNLINAIKLSLLLLNEKKISEYQLYEMISCLSFKGDPRMSIGAENPNKVKNIVDNNLNSFRHMYLPLLETYFANQVIINKRNDKVVENLQIDVSNETKSQYIVELPFNFRRKLYQIYSKKYNNFFAKDLIAQNVVNNPTLISKEDFEKSKNLSYKDLSSIDNLDTNVVAKKDYEYLPTNLKANSEFIQNISKDDNLINNLTVVLKDIIYKPALTQSFKGLLTAGFSKSFDYAIHKRTKYNDGLK
ncbi:hypothetical protein PACTADRAFT_50543 [Pachysolen tannophilus NRRL Y-2460]|uniref:Phosphatidate cytidylyltransferase, mitochondrial n=1 Tax=Pachysolen tannophilus NRRL Y-2460 TaxID=669874 RepID=A0A1E4TSE6_PACTA|nr:hypothetical protein PACTADRAFT_50543 [Pachysolen tannophilus NRRL Y-2460]